MSRKSYNELSIVTKDEPQLDPIEQSLGYKTFLTWNPPIQPVKIGNMVVSEGNGVYITTQGTGSNSQSFWPTIKLEYDKLEQDELSRWVLFHTFVTNNPWTIPSYMGTIHGVVDWLDEPFGDAKDYADFANLAYCTEREKVKLEQKISYEELFKQFQSISEHQTGMVKNLLLDLKPGPQWSHPEMANYSYWRMVVDFSIVDAIIGQQEFCSELHECSLCGKTDIPHHPKSTADFTQNRLAEIVGDEEKASHYMKVIWTVRQNIRHKTAHESAYPNQRLYSELQHGDNEFDIDSIVKNFEKDGHALSALEQNMHEVTRILLLDDALKTHIFPDIRPYMIRSGGMSWEDFEKLITKTEEPKSD